MWFVYQMATYRCCSTGIAVSQATVRRANVCSGPSSELRAVGAMPYQMTYKPLRKV